MPRTRQYISHILALFLLALSQAPAHSCTTEEPTPAIHLSAESPVRQNSGAQVGQGAHSYRFVVRDPQHIKRPYRHGRYQISLKGSAVFPDGTHFYRGTTDSRGRTAVFRFAEAVPLAEWFVLPLVGHGELGETFRLGDDNGCNHEFMVNYPYLLDIESGPVFCGHTLPGGYTPRFMSDKVESLKVYSATLDNDCRRLAKRINPIMAHSVASQRIAGLEHLRHDRQLARHKELLQTKIDTQVFRYGTLKQLKAQVERRLAKADGAKAQSDIYNDTGYNLLVQEPPRHRAYANELLDKSLSLDENLFNLDSKAWALHLAGQDAAALELLNRSMALYGAACTASERSSYPEALAHHGMVLWSLGQRTEALDDWAQADLFTTGGGWTNYIPDWKNIGPLITPRVAQMRADGFVAKACSETPTQEADEAATE